MSDENNQLILACRGNNLSEARRLLSTGRVDVNYKEGAGDTALMEACIKGHIDIARMLLQEFGADVNLTNKTRGWTALMLACQYGHINIARMLLQEFRAEANLPNKVGKTALDLCKESYKAELETIIAELRISLVPVSQPASSAALMPPAPANLSAMNGNPALGSSGPSRHAEQQPSMGDHFATMTAERDNLEEELSRVRAQLRVISEDRNRAMEAQDRLQTQLGVSSEAQNALQTQVRAVSEERDRAVDVRDRAVEERDRAVEERNNALMQLGVVSEERDRAVEAQNRCQAQLDISSPFMRYRPYLIDSVLGLQMLAVGRHVMPPNSVMHRFAEDLIMSGGAFTRLGRLPLAEHRLHHIELVKSNENTVRAFETREQTLRLRRGTDNSPFNFDPAQFSSAQFRVLSALRDSFHELAPATTNRTVRSVYLFHGCSGAVVDNICETGLANLSRAADRGYFGAGFYTTLNIELAARYSSMACQATVGSVIPVVMFAAWIGTAYPITPGNDYGNNPRRDYIQCPNHLPHSDFYGEPLERGFDCHVACVDDTASEAVDRDNCDYVEVVFNQETQVLPVAVLWLEKLA